MANDRELEYSLKLKDEATAVWKKFSSGVQKESSDMGSVVGGLGKTIGAAFTAGAMLKFMGDARDAAAIVSQLDQTLSQQGVTQAGVRDAMVEYSDALKAKTGFEDEEITRLQDQMLAMTGNLAAVRKLTPAVLDLARGTGMSTEAAAKMFSKSVEGAEGLKKLGITIGETANETDRFNAVYDAINKKYGGQAAAWAVTDAGKYDKLKMSMEDFGKSVGKILNEIVGPAMEGLTPIFNWLTSAIPVVVNSLKMAFAALYEAILTPLSGIEQSLNFLGLSQSKLFQGLEASADSLIEKYKKDVVDGITGAGKASKDASDVYAAAAKAQADASAKAGDAAETLKEKLDRLKKELDLLTPGTAAYASKMIEVTKIEKLYSDAADAAKRSTGSLKDELGYLKKDLDDLTPGTDAYGKKMAEIIRIENQFEVATENAKRAAKGFAEAGIADIKFNVKMSKDLSAIDANVAEMSSALKKSILDASTSGPSIMDFFKKDDAGMKDLGKNLGVLSMDTSFKLSPEIDPQKMAEYSKAVDDQVTINAEIEAKKYRASFTSEKDYELDVISEWEKKAIAMAGDSEAMKTDITKIAADERMQVEIAAAQKTMESVSGLAQRGISLISKFTAQQHQAVIQQVENAKTREVKAIDDEREAAKNKYNELMANETLTAAQKDALKKQAEVEDAKILARKTAVEAAYDKQIADEKGKAFDAEKTASMISAIINTAVEVTKVLATPWMIPIVAGLGAAEVALIASQPTPTFHTGGGAFFDAPPSEESMIRIRGQEHIRVTTPEQEEQQQKTGGASIVFNMNFNSPFTDTQAVKKAVIEGLKQTGLTVDRYLTNETGSVVTMR